MSLARCVWPERELPALLTTLARKANMPHAAIVAPPPEPGADPRVWFENACARMGLEAEPVDLWGFRVRDKLEGAAPAAIPCPGGWLAMLDRRGDRAMLLAPDLAVHRVELEEVRRMVSQAIEDRHRPEVESFLEECGIRGARRERAARALLRERSRYERAGVLFQIRVPPGASFWDQFCQAGLHRRLMAVFGARVGETSLWIAAWYILGRDAFQGRADAGWLTAWMLLLATLIPFRMATTWCQGTLAIGVGGLLRQRLLAGALKLSPEEVRTEGAGRFLARAIEAEQMESLALSGGLTSALSLVEIGLAMVVLSLGAARFVQPVALAAWTGLSVWLAYRYWQARAHWTGERLALTHDLVERMTGHRTRLAQQPAAEWHIDEDARMEEYAAASRDMDRAAARLLSLAPSGWMLAGIGSLAHAFLSPDATPATLAVSIGGVLLAWRALSRFVHGAGNLCGAAISWPQIASLFHAAARPERAGSAASAPPAGDVILDVRDLSFRRMETGRDVLNGVDLQLRRGDRVLIEGESGGGKSTLVSLLAGLREPTSGLLLSGGLDRATLGGALWRRRVVAAPQYHENHVLTGPFAYNLLMGRLWPAGPDEMREADQVCRELGLGPLLERMPGGLMQMVGETGWQLSQGERSRMYMARALLQSPDVIVLDESFAALDPENLKQALQCVLRRAKTLVVVAHP